jgi:hypothetical protein
MYQLIRFYLRDFFGQEKICLRFNCSIKKSKIEKVSLFLLLLLNELFLHAMKLVNNILEWNMSFTTEMIVDEFHSMQNYEHNSKEMPILFFILKKKKKNLFVF